MCGISGIVSLTNRGVSESLVTSFNNIIAHRGPDSDGIYIDGNLALGHRRLAIVDLSVNGNQPMHYNNRYTITYNGEVYNYKEIRQVLEQKGYQFGSQSDTEVMLAAYDHWGTACVQQFNGMWAFIIYDRVENRLFISRDRFGVKPLYYFANKELIAFASEIKQFTTLPGWKAELNKQRAVEFISYGILDHSDETLFTGVKQLRGGHNMIYDLANNTFDIQRWYHLEENVRSNSHDKATSVEHFRKNFFNSISLRLRSDVKVGSCLSGGLDSSSIVVTVNKQLRTENKHDIQETVSSCFDNKKYDEQFFIDKVTNKTKTINHKVFPDFNTLFHSLDRILWHQDEPFGSTSIFAQWEVFKTARQNNLIVMLDGQGADEYLVGYHTFYGSYFIHLAINFKWRRLYSEIKWFKKRHHYRNKFLFKALSSVVLPNSVKNLFKSAITQNDHFWLKSSNGVNLAPKWKNERRSIKDKSIDLLLYKNLPLLLHYEDRNSMAFSVESRVPFLDYNLVEYVLSVDDIYKINQGKTKFLLRESMKDLLPEEVFTRYDKMGFVTPEEEWLKKNPGIFKAELENAVKLSNGLIDERILNHFDNIIRGNSGFDFLVWRIIVFGRWIKLFKVQIQ